MLNSFQHLNSQNGSISGINTVETLKQVQGDYRRLYGLAAPQALESRTVTRGIPQPAGNDGAGEAARLLPSWVGLQGGIGGAGGGQYITEL